MWRYGIFPGKITEHLYRLGGVHLFHPVDPPDRVGRQRRIVRLRETVNDSSVIIECQVRFPELRQLDLRGKKTLLGLTFLALNLPRTFLQLEKPLKAARSLQRYSSVFGAGRFVADFRIRFLSLLERVELLVIYHAEEEIRFRRIVRPRKQSGYNIVFLDRGLEGIHTDIAGCFAQHDRRLLLCLGYLLEQTVTELERFSAFSDFRVAVSQRNGNRVPRIPVHALSEHAFVPGRSADPVLHLEIQLGAAQRSFFFVFLLSRFFGHLRVKPERVFVIFQTQADIAREKYHIELQVVVGECLEKASCIEKGLVVLALRVIRLGQPIDRLRDILTLRIIGRELDKLADTLVVFALPDE